MKRAMKITDHALLRYMERPKESILKDSASILRMS